MASLSKTLNLTDNIVKAYFYIMYLYFCRALVPHAGRQRAVPTQATCTQLMGQSFFTPRVDRVYKK